MLEIKLLEASCRKAPIVASLVLSKNVAVVDPIQTLVKLENAMLISSSCVCSSRSVTGVAGIFLVVLGVVVDAGVIGFAGVLAANRALGVEGGVIVVSTKKEGGTNLFSL